MAVAPVCHIPVDEVINQPTSPKFPNIPVATDLNSAYSAINAMRQIMHQITNMQPPSPNKGGGRILNTTKKHSDPKTVDDKQARWQEIKPKRITKTVTVHSSQDKSTTLKIKRIDYVVFQDTKTGELIEWRR